MNVITAQPQSTHTDQPLQSCQQCEHRKHLVQKWRQSVQGFVFWTCGVSGSGASFIRSVTVGANVLDSCTAGILAGILCGVCSATVAGSCVDCLCLKDRQCRHVEDLSAEMDNASTDTPAPAPVTASPPVSVPTLADCGHPKNQALEPVLNSVQQADAENSNINKPGSSFILNKRRFQKGFLRAIAIKPKSD